MGWITRKLRFCIPLGRQELSAPNEGTVRSANMLQHWSMMLDNENTMTYEQLLELDESLGVQKIVLSEETISASLKTQIIHIECSTSNEAEICTICQVEYESGERVGTLNCDHEYHVDCIKRWLRGKNACPICKRPAVSMIDHVPSIVA